MKHAFLTWVDLHPAAYLAGAAGALAAAAALAVRAWRREGTTPRPDWRWGLMLFLVLLAGRWPSVIMPREMHADESQLFAGAHALAHDPVPWRTFDPVTSGPLNAFVLMPAGVLAGWDSYLAPRLTALVCAALGLTLVHQCLALVVGPGAGRLATLATAGFEALTNSVDLQHFSSELLPGVWFAGAAYAAVRRWHEGGGPRWSGLGGLLLGAVAMTKLQAVPLAAAAGLAWTVAELRPRGDRRHLLLLLGGAAAVPGLFLAQVALAGEWTDFVTSYVRSNLAYTALGDSSLRSLLAGVLAKSREEDSLLELWGGGMLIWVCSRPDRRPGPIQRRGASAGWRWAAPSWRSAACCARAGLSSITGSWRFRPRRSWWVRSSGAARRAQREPVAG